MEIISLRFKYTEEEYVAATRLYQMRSTEFMIRLIVCSVCVVAGVYLMALLEVQSELLILFIFAALLPFIIGFTYLIVGPRQAFRREPKFREEYLLQFSDEGIQFKTAEIDALVQWSLYSKVIENERFYLLVYGQNMISVLPKRAFNSAHQEDAFDAMLKRKLPLCFDSKRLRAHKADELERAYLPPAEPPDWR